MRRRVKKQGAPAEPAEAAHAAPAATKKRMLDLDDEPLPAPQQEQRAVGGGKRGAAASVPALDAGRGAKSDGDDVLHVNEAFAKRFEYNKRREEMHRLMERHGGELTDSDASTSESEDDEAMLLTDKVEQQVLETISAIRRRDPAIYDSKKAFFANPDELPDDELALDRGKSSSDAAARSKPLTLKDYEREAILKHGGLPAGSDSEDDARADARPLTHVEEQRQLKESFLRAAAAAAGDDLLTVRKKSSAEAERESREFAEWSKKHGPSTAAGEDILAKAFGDESALDEKDRFLRDYIMGRAWVDDDGTGSRVPTYKEIVGDVGQSTDEEELENMDAFENKFNFRFEEGDAGAIQTYARDVPGSVRRKDDSRKKKREEKRAREEEASKRNKEEIRRLKSLKKQEIERRMQQLQQVSGASADAVRRLFEEAEEDFDQDKFDQRMQSLFDEQYYGDSADDRKKPTVENDDVLRQLLEEPDPYASGEGSDDGSPAPAPAPTAASSAGRDSATQGAGGAKASKAAKRGEVQKSKAEVKRLLREYNELYYDEKTGSVADRFPYVQVKPNTFGWSLRDILELDDKDLNGRVSVKKLAPYRDDEYKPRSRALHWKTVRHRELHGGKHAPKADDEQQNANDDNEPLTAIDELGADASAASAAAAGGASGGTPGGDELRRKRRHRSKKRGAAASAQ